MKAKINKAEDGRQWVVDTGAVRHFNNFNEALFFCLRHDHAELASQADLFLELNGSRPGDYKTTLTGHVLIAAQLLTKNWLYTAHGGFRAFDHTTGRLHRIIENPPELMARVEYNGLKVVKKPSKQKPYTNRFWCSCDTYRSRSGPWLPLINQRACSHIIAVELASRAGLQLEREPIPLDGSPVVYT